MPVEKERPLHGLAAILTKEFSHIRRDRVTLFFMFVIPAIQLTIFGYALDTKVELIPTVVMNLDGRRESEYLLEAFVNSRKFRIVEQAVSDDAFHRAMTSGRAKVGIRIPADYSDKILRRENAVVGVLIDGSDSQVATSTLTTVKLLGFTSSLQKGRAVSECLADHAPPATRRADSRFRSSCARGCCTTRTCSASGSSCPAWSASSCSS